MSLIRNLFYLSLMLYLTACGKKHQYGNWPSEWPAELDTYLTSYISDAERLGTPVDIDWLSLGKGSFVSGDKLPSSVVGQCTWVRDIDELSPLNWWTIELDADAFFAMDEHRRLNLVYHELGHCLHMMDHRTEVLAGGQPKSFMYPYVLSSYYVKNYKQEYIFELFKFIWPN